MISKVAVIGAGLMGSGIAQSIASAGFCVVNIDVSAPQIERAKGNIKTLFAKRIANAKMTQEEADRIQRQLTYSTSFDAVHDADLIIEAVPEQMELKKSVFAAIDVLAHPKAIFLSNTSGLSISEMASATNRPHQMMGVHFFYPAPVMKLVELIRAIATDDETYHCVKDFCLAVGKETVDAKELPGFLVNRILVPMMNEGAFCVMEGATPHDVDKAMKLGANLPMGPLELADFVGLDVMLATMEGLYNGFADSKYRPCPLIKTLVTAGHLGRKSGKGFYTYEK